MWTLSNPLVGQLKNLPGPPWWVPYRRARLSDSQRGGKRGPKSLGGREKSCRLLQLLFFLCLSIFPSRAKAIFRILRTLGASGGAQIRRRRRGMARQADRPPSFRSCENAKAEAQSGDGDVKCPLSLVLLYSSSLNLYLTPPPEPQLEKWKMASRPFGVTRCRPLFPCGTHPPQSATHSAHSSSPRFRLVLPPSSPFVLSQRGAIFTSPSPSPPTEEQEAASA